MKKFSLVVLVSMLMTSCVNYYVRQGNAQVVNSQFIGKTAEGKDVVKLLIQKDNGETVVMTREYDAHVVPGARVLVADNYNHQTEDLVSIRRYEFK